MQTLFSRRRVVVGWLSLVAAGAVLSISAGTEAQTATKRIVLLAGRPSHPPGMHEFRAGSLLLQKSLSGVKGVTVDVIANGWPVKMEDGKPVDDNTALQ